MDSESLEVQNADMDSELAETQETQQQDLMTPEQVKAFIAEYLSGDQRYAALQTALNRNIERFRREVAERDARIAELQARLEGTAEATDFIGAKLLAALPDEDRAKVEAELRDRELRQLRKELAELKKPAMAGNPVAAQQYDDFEEQLKRVLIEARESLEDTVRSHGLDPKDKALDYGREDEPFAARLKKLNASIVKAKAAKEEAETDRVRQKAPITPTRTGGGAATGTMSGADLLRVGAEEVWEKMLRSRAARR